MKKTKYITFSALMSALSVVILLLGSIIDVLDLTAVLITAVFLLIARHEMGSWALAIYFVTGLIAFLVLPNKLVSIEYAIIAIYPMLKPLIDKQSSIVKWLLKLVYILASALGLVLIMKLFTPDSPLYWDGIFAITYAVIFFMYDILLFKFSMFYGFKLRNKLRIDKFFNQN